MLKKSHQSPKISPGTITKYNLEIGGVQKEHWISCVVMVFGLWLNPQGNPWD